MEVVIRCENYVQVDALTVVDFTMLYVPQNVSPALSINPLKAFVISSYSSHQLLPGNRKIETPGRSCSVLEIFA